MQTNLSQIVSYVCLYQGQFIPKCDGIAPITQQYQNNGALRGKAHFVALSDTSQQHPEMSLNLSSSAFFVISTNIILYNLKMVCPSKDIMDLFYFNFKRLRT